SRLLRITTLAAWMDRVSQVTFLPSITVPAVVIVHGPVYATRATLAGTPVLPGPGQQPPHGSAAPGTFFPATGQGPDGCVEVGGGGGGWVVVGFGVGRADGSGGSVGVGSPVGTLSAWTQAWSHARSASVRAA